MGCPWHRSHVDLPLPPLKSAVLYAIGGAQVQSLTPTPSQHFGPLKGGGGDTPFFEPPWCLGNIHTHADRAATSRSTHAKSNLANHLIMISTNVVCHKPCYEQTGRDTVA